MNWNKALNRLIIIFVLVNITLGIANYNKNVRAYKLPPRRIENVMKVFEGQGSQINCNLPRKFAPVESLWMEPFEVSSKKRDELVKRIFGEQSDQVIITQVESSLPYGRSSRMYRVGDKSVTFAGTTIFYQDESVALRPQTMTQNEVEKQAATFLKQIGLEKYTKNTKIEYRSGSYGGIITYYEVYEGIPLFDNFVALQVTQQGVATFYGQSVNVVKSSTEPKSIYPIDQVLYGLLDEPMFENPITVEAISMGYAMEDSGSMHILKEEAIPMYKVTLQGLDQPVFVNAYTNKMEEHGMSYFYK